MISTIDTRTWPDELRLIQDEPALKLDRPQVFQQPPAPRFFAKSRASLSPLVRRALAARDAGDTPAFGAAYGELVVAFRPGLDWAISCWDYLLSTEDCRFVPRDLSEKRYCRGDYRALTDRDFPRFVHRVFKQHLLNYRPGEHDPSLHGHLRRTFWQSVLGTYRRLEQPADARQRTLTALSYLRCTPYRFLNEHHESMVRVTIHALPMEDRLPIERYHLRFYTQDAAAAELGLSSEAFEGRLQRALASVRGRDLLSYYLLRQIERY